LSSETGKSAAQVALRWVLQQGAVVLPRSSNAQRMRLNLDLFSFQLSRDQMERVAEMSK
jgi:diketogulonate reductase-like aldo/keto reductase